MTSALAGDNAPKFVTDMLKSNTCVLISASQCGYCGRVKTIFPEIGQAFVSLEVNVMPNGREVMAEVTKRTGVDTVPQLFIRGKYVGGYDEIMSLHRQDKLVRLIAASGAIRR